MHSSIVVACLNNLLCCKFQSVYITCSSFDFVEFMAGVIYWQAANGSLQTVLRKNPFGPFESYYLPVNNKVLSATANFLLEPLLTNTSYGGSLDDDWTYFLLDIPSAAAGGNMHIRLSSDVRIEYQIYARYGGLSSLDNWDYYYINATSSSSSSMFFKVYESTEVAVSFYILYVRGGTWSIALRNPMPFGSANKSQTTMSISIERCPRRCSSHGSCQTVMDANGLTLYRFSQSTYLCAMFAKSRGS